MRDRKKRGRKPISPEIVEKVLQLAKSNPDWGYEHMAGTMRYLGYKFSATTIRHILEVNGIVPDPERPITRRLVSIHRNAAVCNRVNGFCSGRTFDSIRTGS